MMRTRSHHCRDLALACHLRIEHWDGEAKAFDRNKLSRGTCSRSRINSDREAVPSA